MISRKKLKQAVFLSFFLFFYIFSFGQPTNDDCDTRFRILDPIDFCGQFTTVGASDAGFGAATCFNGNNNDVWFEFTAFATAIYIVINGTNANLTFTNPQLALYSGSCSGSISQLACSNDVINGAVDLLQNGLIVGTKYLIRVSGQGNSEGTFQLCTSNYNPPVEPGQDCPTGAVLCDKSPFSVQVLSGGGALPDEGDGTCLEGANPNTFTEDQSTWLKWTAATSGSITFTITPINAKDDIDFAFYELDGGISACTKTKLRCVATSCVGPTGLNLTSNDLEENYDCQPGEDGFVRSVDMLAGKSYGLLINNFSNSGIGFNIEFGGTGEFAGPVADFTIDPSSGLKCDQTFRITDNSTDANGTIVSYNWIFGEKAIPSNSTTKGPHDVNYESFGEKFVVLTIESSLGCKITNVLPLVVDPCCEDLAPLSISVDTLFNPTCPASTDGFVVLGAQGGGGKDYMYDIKGNSPQSSNKFEDLAAGTYQITLTDIKGCRDSIDIEVNDPQPVIVDAGRDTIVDLGCSTKLMGNYSPLGNYKIEWTPSAGLADSSKLITDVIPPGNTTYTLNITSDAGCEFRDDVFISVNQIRDIEAPNIFSPNQDGDNDFFNLKGQKWVQGIDLLQIFDRWGNKLYQENNVPLGDFSKGWNGTCNGTDVASGVYVWVASVRYVDNVVLQVKGDITLIR